MMSLIDKRAIAAGIAGSVLAMSVPATALLAEEAPSRVLRVCADPNNLPFSNQREEGFENKIVELIARQLHATVKYTWWAQRRGYARNTLKADQCDLWPGVATNVDTLETTQPYYRSSYVFISRAERDLDVDSFDDARLDALLIGVQMIGNNASNTPPSHALAKRGITDNVRGYMIYGDYAQSTPQAAIVDAVASGAIDIAIVWGPLGGYFAARAKVPLRVMRVRPDSDGPGWPMAFDISMGVRRQDEAFKQTIDHALAADKRQIDAILASYGVPPADGSASESTASMPSPSRFPD